MAILCGWFWFLSIPLTSAVVNTVLYQTCCVWCYLISIFVLGEGVTLIKILSTFVTFAGVAVIGMWPCTEGSRDPETPDAKEWELAGEGLVLFSSFLYALYEVS